MNQPDVQETKPEELGPNCVEAEEALLGAILNRPGIMTGVAARIRPEHFFMVRNALVYGAMLAVYDRDEDVHTLVVLNELRHAGLLDQIGGVAYLIRLENTNQDPAYADVFAGLVFAAALRRQLLDASKTIANEAATGQRPIRDIAELAEAAVFEVTRQVNPDGGEGEVSAAKAIALVSDQLLTYTQDRRDVRGYRTGIDRLDKVLHGVVNGDLIGVIGRSGSGKTTLMCQFTLAAVDQGLNVVHFPTEQTVGQYITNLASHLLKVPLEDIYEGRVDASDLLDAQQLIRQWSIAFYDRTGPSPQQVTSFVREKIRQRRCDLVIVDGLNDMYVPKGDTWQKTVECMTALHSIMREGVPVIFSVQANRGPADRRNKRPLMSDAQGGGIIEQKVTRFLSLYRPGYDLEVGEIQPSDSTADIDPRYVEIQVLKDRFFNKQGSVVKGIWIAGRGFQDASATLPERTYA